MNGQSDTLGSGANYQWSITGFGARGSVTPVGTGQAASAEARVDPKATGPSTVRIDVYGMDSAYDESDGSVEVSLPRAHAWLKVIRSMSTAHGASRMRNPSGPGWIGQKAVLMQAYATVMVRLSWHHLVGPATKVEWVISDSSNSSALLLALT
jgi:hypothetical protein